MSNIFLLILISFYVSHTEVHSGLINSLAAVNKKNSTGAVGLPIKKNETSKYNCIKTHNKEPLDTIIDAHKPSNFTFQDAADKLVDVNRLSEKQLEAIGDAAIAAHLTEKPISTSTNSDIGNSTHTASNNNTTDKQGLKGKKDSEDTEECTII